VSEIKCPFCQQVTAVGHKADAGALPHTTSPATAIPFQPHGVEDNFYEPPSNAFMIFGKQYVYPHRQQFVLQEKVFSWSGDSFDIYDDQGRIRFKIKGKIVTLRQRKRLYDHKDQLVGQLLHKGLTLHRTVKFYSATKEVVAVAKKSAIFQLKSNADVHLKKRMGQTGGRDVKIRGSFFAQEFTFYDSHGNALGELHRKVFNFSNLFLGKDTYELVVFPNVDCAFMILVAVAMDEMFSDDRQRKR